MAALPEVMARLGCARMLLMRSKDTAQHAIVSRLQADAVVDLMQRQAVEMADMAPGMRAKMGALATAGAWCPGDMAKIMSLVQPPAPLPRQAAVRTKMQKFTPNILNYFTAAEWDRMQGQQSLGAAVDFLIGRLHQLGGRCLSEPCKAWCSSLLLSLHGLGNATEATKKQVLEYFKKEYANRGRKAAKQEPCLLELPHPSELKAKYPQLHYSVFGDSEPVPSRIDIGLVDLPRVSCRSTNKQAQMMARAQYAMDRDRSQQSAPAGGPSIAFLEQIVNLQKDNLQLIKDSVVGRQGVPKCLMALQSQPVAPLQGSVHERLALPPAPDPNRDVNLGESRGSASLGGPRQQASFGVSSLSIGRQSQEASLGVPRLAIASGAAFPAETLQSQDTQECDRPAEVLLHIVPAPSPAPAATTAAIASGEEALLQIVPVPSPAPAATTAAIAAGAAFPAETLQSPDTQEGDKLAAAALQIVPVPSTAPAASTALAATSSADSCLARKILMDMGVMNNVRAVVKRGPGGSAVPKRKAAGPKRKVAAPKAQAAIEDTGEPNEEAVAAPKRKAAPKAQAAIADTGEPKKKWVRVDHEASRCSWRVRFPDNTSKGFTYKRGADPSAMYKEAEEYAIQLGFKVAE